MTPREAAIITAYTEISFGGKNFHHFHEYVEEKFGHPVWTHEMADKEFWLKLKELSRDDFMELVKSISQKGQSMYIEKIKEDIASIIKFIAKHKDKDQNYDWDEGTINGLEIAFQVVRKHMAKNDE